jgi:hypothetical protein
MNLNIEDRTGAQQNYDAGRGGQSVVLLVCHKTAGVADLATLNAVEAKAGVEATIRWLSLPAGHGGGGVSAHYLIGPEVLGAPIYRLVKESDTAWHAGGTPPQFPSTWTDASTGVTYTKYAVNQISIGIEIWGRINDPIGPNQRLAAIHLVQDIVSRYPVLQKAGHIQAHAALEADRRDGTDWVALAGATASQYTATKTPTPPLPLPPLTLNGHTLQHGFKDYWTANGSVTVFGLPITEEMQEGALVVQYFERARLEYNPVTKLITRGLVGTEAYNAKYPATPIPLVPPAVKP